MSGSPYLPHTAADIKTMLDRIGVASLPELFSDIPEAVRLKKPLNLPSSKAEWDVLAALKSLAAKNQCKTLFIGGGSYDHIIPAALAPLVNRSEFLTAYTPYQPEISQGILQALFEFQSAMAEITGLPVANASLYDGFSAAAEACTMALNQQQKKNVLLIAATVHPYMRHVLNTYFSHLDVSLITIEEKDGRTDLKSLKVAMKKAGKNLAAVLVQSPNFYGSLEDLRGWASSVHALDALLIISAHPLSLAAFASPAEWGADIAIGDTQALGISPYFGGPSAGYITCKKSLMRRMPGRIVGESLDKKGNRGFVLTLQAREQHIKRERASSNICTNQTLIALANVVYLSLLGPGGFQEVAKRNTNGAMTLCERLTEDLGLTRYNRGYFFNEFTLEIPVPREQWLSPFRTANIAPGFYLSDLDPTVSNALFAIAVTEKRRASEIEAYVSCAREALR